MWADTSYRRRLPFRYLVLAAGFMQVAVCRGVIASAVRFVSAMSAPALLPARTLGARSAC